MYELYLMYCNYMSISTWGIGITYKFPYKESLYSEIPAVYEM